MVCWAHCHIPCTPRGRSGCRGLPPSFWPGDQAWPLRDHPPGRPLCPVPGQLAGKAGQLRSGGRAGGEDSPQWGLASPQLREEAWKWFAALDNPLTTLLDMLDASRGCGGRDPSLEAWVARELERWLQAQPHPGPAQVSPTLGPWPVPKSHPFSPRPALHTGPHTHLTLLRQPTGGHQWWMGLWASDRHVPGSLNSLVCAPAHPQRPPTSLRLQALAAPHQAHPGLKTPATAAASTEVGSGASRAAEH